jgi:hypothetical protein
VPSPPSGPPASATPGPSLGQEPGITGLGADQTVFQDGFSDDSLWGTQSAGASGSVAYVNDALQITVTTDSQGLWSYHQLASAEPVMRIEGTVLLSPGSGAAGYQCGNASDDYLFGVINGGNEWVIGRILDSATTVLTRGPLPTQVDAGSGGSARLTIECAVTPGTDDRMLMWVDDTQVADVNDAPRVGPYDRVGAFVTTATAPFSASFDDVTVWVGDAYAPQGPATAVSALLAHVPDGFRNGCVATQPAAGSGLVAGVLCKPAGDADQAEYYQYASNDNMEAAFRSILPDASQITGQACDTGPSLVGYNIDEQTAGRLACFPNPGSLGGILFVWTDTELGILSFGVSQQGSYADLFDWWQGAGPLR